MIFEYEDLVPAEPMQIKGSPPGSLLARLTEYVFKRHSPLAGLVPQLWQRFVDEVEKYYKSGLELPATVGNPDHMCCLIHQKLQMVNCCIQAAKEQPASNETAVAGDDDDDDDEMNFEDLQTLLLLYFEDRTHTRCDADSDSSSVFRSCDSSSHCGSCDRMPSNLMATSLLCWTPQCPRAILWANKGRGLVPSGCCR